MSNNVRKLHPVNKKKTLNQMLQQLPIQDLDNKDLIALIVQFLQETPDDKTLGDYATRSKVKLDALRLIHDILKTETKSAQHDELLDLLADDEE